MADYSYLGEAELLKRLARIDEALDTGSQTGVGIEARVTHTFAGKTDAELRVRRDEYAYGLFRLAIQSKDPDMLAKYKNPYNRAQSTRPNFGGAVGTNEFYG